MAEPTDDDLIIQIAQVLRHRSEAGQPFSIEYKEMDESWELPAGSTAKHIEAAAADAGLEITRKGTTHASLKRKSPGVSFRQSPFDIDG